MSVVIHISKLHVRSLISPQSNSSGGGTTFGIVRIVLAFKLTLGLCQNLLTLALHDSLLQATSKSWVFDIIWSGLYQWLLSIDHPWLFGANESHNSRIGKITRPTPTFSGISLADPQRCAACIHTHTAVYNSTYRGWGLVSRCLGWDSKDL